MLNLNLRICSENQAFSFVSQMLTPFEIYLLA